MIIIVPKYIGTDDRKVLNSYEIQKVKRLKCLSDEAGESVSVRFYKYVKIVLFAHIVLFEYNYQCAILI